jgi:glyoxylase-like metal-dependent hydrolase (beta-lactamase superfamily II)
VSETGNGSVEAVYEAIRKVAGVVAPPPPAGDVATGVRVRPLRTPTLPPAAHTGCYVIGPTSGRGALIVVDPASPYPEEQASLDDWLEAEAADGRPLAAIALTHHHGDHVGGAMHLAQRTGAPVLAHTETARLLAGRVEVTRTLADDEELEAGGVVARAVWTPGHAAGHLCFAVGDALICGDMVAGVGTILVDPDEGDMGQYLGSLARMQALAPARLLPAHGPVIADAAGKLREYVAHRRMREHRIVDALRDAGAATPRDLVPVAYADTPPPMWFLAERSLVAHLMQLEREGRAVTDGGTWRLL